MYMILIIGIIIVMTLFGLFLKYLNYRNRNAPIPENVRDIYDEDTYKKRSAYDMENLRLGILSSLINTAIFVAVLVFGVHSRAFYHALSFTNNEFLRTYFMFAIPYFIAYPFGLIFELISTFKIEAKYDFNKTSAFTFVKDCVLELVFVNGLVMMGLVSVFMLLHNAFGNMVFIVFFFILLLVMMFVMMFMSFIIRLFNKLTPLEDGSLKDKITELSSTLGFPIKRIMVIDGSKRSTKPNAMFTGFGKLKTVMLYDTLIKDFSEDEVLAVVAHEIGHSKGKHLWKMMPMQLLSFAALMGVAFFVINSAGIAYAFGFEQINAAFGLYVTFVISGPLMQMLSIPASIRSRKHEYEADAYEVKYVGVEPAISAMKKIYRKSFGNLTPHPFVVFISYSHPTASQRIAAMENFKKRGQK